MRKIKIGTRKSPLALIQAQIVQQTLIKTFPQLEGQCDIVSFLTTGDRLLDRKLDQVGGKGLFTKEIEEALLRCDVDMAVHSMKDMPTYHPTGLCVACILPRSDPRDVFISKNNILFKDLPKGTLIGTSSLRRQAQLLQYRPDLNITLLRGNVQTRLQKLYDSPIEATLLAQAGLKRLQLTQLITEIFATDFIVPAVGQGALGIECRDDDTEIRAYLEQMNHIPSMICLQAERALLEFLDGSCRTPIGGYALITPQQELKLTGFIADPEGTNVRKATFMGPINAPDVLGRTLGQHLKSG